VNRTIEVALRANIAQFQAQMGAAAAQVRSFGGSIDQVVRQHRAGFDLLGKAGMAMGLAVVAGVGLSVKAAIDFESAFAGVTKTVDGTTEQMGKLRQGILDMAKEVPASAGEIAAVAEAAGALGIATEDVLGFTKVMIDLGETTNLTAEEAATGLARFSNIMGTSADDVERLGSTLVDLGNKGASTEDEILELGLRLAGAGKQAGLSEDEVLGFANALSSMGINAEAGGTAMSRVFIKLNDAVIDGSEKLNVFAEVAGMSAEEFRSAYQEDASGAIVAFVAGLGRMQESGQSTTAVLDDLELGEIRVSDALRRTAGNSQVLTESLNNGKTAWEENAALQAEAEKRYQTTAAQLEILRNNVVDLAIGFGDRLLPVVRGMADGTGDLIRGFQTLPDWMKTVVAVAGSLLGVLAGLAGTMLVFGQRLREGVAAIQAFSAAFPRLSGAIGGVTVGLAGTAAVLGTLASAMGKAEARADEMVEALRADIDTTKLESWREASEKATRQVEDLRKVVGQGWKFGPVSAAGFKGLLEVLTPMENKIIDNAAALKALEEAEDDLVLTTQTFEWNARMVAEQLGLTSTEVEGLARKVGVDLAGEYGSVLPAMRAAYDEMTRGTTVSQKAYLSLEEQEEAAKELEKTYENLGKAFGEMVNLPDAYTTVFERNQEAAQAHAQAVADSTEDASDSWEDYVGDVAASLGEVEAELRRRIQAYDEFETNLLKIAARGREDLARELAGMGEIGVAVAAQLVDASDEEFSRFADTAVEASAKNIDKIGQNFHAGFEVAAEIARQGSRATVDSVTEALSGLPGMSEEYVRDTTRRMNIALKETQPEWDRAWSERTNLTTTQLNAMLQTAPPLVQESAETINRYLAQTYPDFAFQMASRRGVSVEEMQRLLKDAPPPVRDALALMEGHLSQTAPEWDESWGWRARHAVGEMGALRGQAPPIVGDAVEQVNRQARDREPAWMDSWGWRTRHAVGEMGALRGQVPPMVGQTADGMNHELGSRLPNFQRIVADYQNALASGVRTVGIALGEKYSSINFLADGGIVNFADGGVKESHQAQIARAGDWRVWAEPETGGEAYIPLSPSKRARSMGILEEVADRFGMEVTPPTLDYHSGGLYTPPGSPSFDDYGPPIRPAGADTTDSMEEAIAEWARRHMQLPHHTEPVGGGGDYAGGGKALDRVRSMLGDFPGLRITSTYRSPEHNRRIGGAKNSYHMDRNNPAVDVAGSHGQMSAFAAAARRAGGWREGPLWQVKGHYDHVHVAEDGTIIDFKSFDRGGILEPGLTLAHNGTGQPEVVTTASNVPTPAQTGVERYGPQSSPNAPTPNQYAGTARYGPQSMTIQVGAANAPAGSQTSGLDRYGPQTRPGSSANNVPTLNQTTGIDRYGDQLAESVDGVRSGSVNSLATVEARLLSIDQRLGSIEGVLTTPAPVPATTNERRQTVPSMAQRFGMNEEEWAQRFEQMIPTLAQRLGMAEDEWASFDARRRPNEAPTPAEAHGMTEPEWESYIARTRPNTAPTMAQRTATYDDGGWLMPGWTNAYNGTGKPERVLPDEAPVLLSYDDLRARVDDLALTLEAQLGPVEKPSAMSPVEDRKDKLVERSLGMGHEQGSIFNPYIRDAGGPLLPGYTYNGTGRPEQVVPASISPAGGSVVYQDNRTIKISGHTAWSLREFQRAMEKIDKDRSYVGGRR
jgi:TP901 family phage tail tape measure protein